MHIDRRTSCVIACVVGSALLAGCGSRVVGGDTVANDAVAEDTRSDAPIPPPADEGVDVPTDTGGVPLTPGYLDLLLEVDNSNSMRDNQSNLLAQLGPLVQALTSPPCRSPSDPTNHTCDPTNPSDMPIYPPVQSLHVGVISQDLGTHGSAVPGCVASETGDDGLLNPIRNGAALAMHEPWVSAPPTFGRPTDCTDPNEFPSFITFTSGVTSVMQFTHDFQCNAGLYVNGCGLEQQLEAIERALLVHNPSDSAGNSDPNAGFLRADALLAIIVLSDEEDGSVRDCNYAMGQPCSDALDVFNAASTLWSSMNLNLRDYLYQPGGVQDPTWPLDRYLDPTNPDTGWPSLKPGHPERVIFGAITGVPLPNDGPGTSWLAADGVTVDWDMLLGTPASNPNDFTHRDSHTAIQTMSAEGPVSMLQANLDTNCPERVVPACRRAGTTYNATYCTTDQQYFAWPARRIVEVARRFDQAPFCGGAPCHSGFVTSICSSNYAAVLQSLIPHLH